MCEFARALLNAEIGLIMSKYDALWQYLQQNGSPTVVLSFEDIARLSGTELDHSFLNYKKELTAYGYTVKRISLKLKTVIFDKLKD